MSDIRLDQKVIAYADNKVVYEGLWKDAPEDVLDCDADWYLLSNVEDADVILILNDYCGYNRH